MDSDRSLSSGLSIPQWMKSKMIDNRLDLDQGAFSPPGHDDSFLYIRYPRKSRDDGRQTTENNFLSEIPDPNKHLAPCRPFLTGVSPAPVKQFKSNGTDDGFKGKAAACGTSIVKVAHQMVSEKRQQHQLQQEVVDFPSGFNSKIRRGSKSLPVSPIMSPSSSPKAQRKLLSQNKYFTSAFSEADKNGSWILSSLLRKRETLEEEVTGSVPDLSVSEDSQANIKPAITQVFKAKPSELREMNFWSPTSM